MSKFITDEILGEREKRILGGHVDLLNPDKPDQKVNKGQIVLKNNKYYGVKKDGNVDFSTSIPNAEYLKPLKLSSGGSGGIGIEELKKKLTHF